MITFKAKSSVTRAAVREISKETGLDLVVIKENINLLIEVSGEKDAFYETRLPSFDEVIKSLLPEVVEIIPEPIEAEIITPEIVISPKPIKVKLEINYNILRVSEIVKPCRRVWDIATEHQIKFGDRLSRKAVIDQCTKEGIAYNTARTQYQLWYRASNPVAVIVELPQVDSIN